MDIIINGLRADWKREGVVRENDGVFFPAKSVQQTSNWGLGLGPMGDVYDYSRMYVVVDGREVVAASGYDDPVLPNPSSVADAAAHAAELQKMYEEASAPSSSDNKKDIVQETALLYRCTERCCGWEGSGVEKCPSCGGYVELI